MKRINVFLKKAVISCMLTSAFLCNFISYPVIGSAASTKWDTRSDPLIVVSLGDSYSSGEGIEPFYGQSKDFFEKVEDENWLAHRSRKSWPGLLDFSEYYDNIEGTLSGYNVIDEDYVKLCDCKWYFVASSGATTENITDKVQSKPVSLSYPSDYVSDWSGDPSSWPIYEDNTKSIPVQSDILDKLGDTVDYITLSIGGNDVNFSEIVAQCVTESPTIHYLFWNTATHKYTPTHLEQQLNALLSDDNKKTLKEKFSNVYTEIAGKAPNAEIIVAGYPKLFDKDGKGLPIAKSEAELVNNSVTELNKLISEVVSEKQEDGMKIHFVDVEKEFDKDGDHQAYSSDNWINPVWLQKKSEDLEDSGVGSDYSIHPNEKGAQAYARCVNETIKEIEEKEKRGTVSGTVLITDSNGNDIPVSNAEIYAFKLRDDGSYNSNYIYTSGITDENGNYSLKPLPVGKYKIIISADEYEGTTFDATIRYGQLGNNGEVLIDNSIHEKTYLPSPNSTFGVLAGKVCKASDHSSPIGNADINVLTMDDSLYLSSVTNSLGNYELNLPVGDYKINISADGYIPFECYATVTEDDITYLETFLMVQGEEGQIGIAKGKVFDSLTGNGVADVILTLYKGWNNPKNTEMIFTSITNSSGEYSVELPYGNYTVYAEKDGYITSKFNIVVQEGTTNEQNGTLIPTFIDDEYHFILTWGENPNDLDSHVEGNLSNGTPFHVYYRHMSDSDGNIIVCELDVDDTTSYGPETITLTPTTSGAYYYYIFRYDGKGTISNSEAKIVVYKGKEMIKIFNVPTNLGESDYWNVFAIKDGEIIVQNTITDSADVNYAE